MRNVCVHCSCGTGALARGFCSKHVARGSPLLLGKNLGVGTADVVGLEIFGGDCFARPNLLPANACDRFAGGALDLLHHTSSLPGWFRYAAVGSEDSRDSGLVEELAS